MKNYILIMLLAVFTFSCETTVECEDNPAAGFLATADGKVPARDANPANLDLWDKYIEAHNNRDLETIASMNIDSTDLGQFRILGPTGQIIRGTEEHSEFLKMWFDVENPKWNTYFSYSMKVDGQQGEWVISGAQVKKTVDGQEVTSYDIADVYILDGKIGAFWVYTRAEVPQQ
jgi:hypothetical protein